MKFWRLGLIGVLGLVTNAFAAEPPPFWPAELQALPAQIGVEQTQIPTTDFQQRQQQQRQSH